MDYDIVEVQSENYTLFDDMIYWRLNDFERIPSKELPSNEIVTELSNPNLYIYAVQIQAKHVGWIALIYLPKVGKYNGHGHIYVDELWIEPTYRKHGLAKALMKKADELAWNSASLLTKQHKIS